MSEPPEFPEIHEPIGLERLIDPAADWCLRGIINRTITNVHPTSHRGTQVMYDKLVADSEIKLRESSGGGVGDGKFGAICQVLGCELECLIVEDRDGNLAVGDERGSASCD